MGRVPGPPDSIEFFKNLKNLKILKKSNGEGRAI